MSKLITWIHAVWTPVNIVLLFIISFSFRHGSIQNKFDSFLARSTTLLSVFDRKFWTKRTLSFLKTDICIYVVNCFIKCPFIIQHRKIMQTKCITNFCFLQFFDVNAYRDLSNTCLNKLITWTPGYSKPCCHSVQDLPLEKRIAERIKCQLKLMFW